MALQNMNLSTTLESLMKDLTFFFRRGCNSGTEDIVDESEICISAQESRLWLRLFFSMLVYVSYHSSKFLPPAVCFSW